MVISKGFGAYNAPKGVVKDIGKAGMPLWGPRFTLKRPCFKIRWHFRWHSQPGRYPRPAQVWRAVVA